MPTQDDELDKALDQLQARDFYDALQAIEKLGASEDFTKCVNAVAELQKECGYAVSNRAETKEAIQAYLNAKLQRVVDNAMEKEKLLQTDLDEDNIGDFDEPHKFCIECGHYEIEGELDCKCAGYNQALVDVKQLLKDEMEKL